MAENEWLPLFEYSNKYRISVSTLRRRIKAEDIQYKLDGGRYFIIDAAPDNQPKESTSQKPKEEPTKVIAKPSLVLEAEEPVFTTASKLLDELKKAYTLVLHEKDEQIRILREEISDLRTLVRVLDTENQEN
jgi:hypothetical protein